MSTILGRANVSARSVIDEAGPNLGRPLVVGAGLASTRETIALTRKVAEAGADAVLIIPSGYFASLMTRDALKHFFIDVAAASPVPVLMYNFPGAAGGVDMDSVLIEEVATAAPNIVGAKLTYVLAEPPLISVAPRSESLRASPLTWIPRGPRSILVRSSTTAYPHSLSSAGRYFSGIGR